MKILLLDSSFPINTRNRKILGTLSKQSSFEVRYCTWNRDNRPVPESEKHNYIYNLTSPYGARLKKVKSLRNYYKFFKREQQKFKPDIVIASHWDMLMLAVLSKSSTQKIIYENLDMPTSHNPILYKIFRKIEQFLLKRTDGIIFASRFFESQYKYFDKPVITVENKPFRLDFQPDSLPVANRSNNQGLKVCYLGTVRYFDMLRILADATNQSGVLLDIWGDGADLPALQQYTRNQANVTFHGRYDYEIIASIYEQADIIWAVYPANDPNVKFAISNKYHECILFRKPGVFAAGTYLGEMVASAGIGYSVNSQSVDDIKQLFARLAANPKELSATRMKMVQHYATRLNWEDEEDRLLNFINKVGS